MRQTAQPDIGSLGTFVRERRLALGLTQTELADRLGYVQERISLIENGKYGMPSVPALAGIARALEVGLSDILAAAGYSEFIAEQAAREPAGHRTAESGATGAAAMRHFIQESGRLAVSLRDLQGRVLEAQAQLEMVDLMRSQLHAQRTEFDALTASLSGRGT